VIDILSLFSLKKLFNYISRKISLVFFTYNTVYL